MTLSVHLRPIARAELQQAYTWYEEQREGLGEDFLLCIEASLDVIRDNPHQFPVMHDEIRRAVIRRFPYAIFYLVKEMIET